MSLHCFSQAISRGVHFEIVYGPMIRDAAARRSTITNANLLVELCRGKVSNNHSVVLFIYIFVMIYSENCYFAYLL